MRTLVVADIHGNIAALDAVLAVPHDALLCLGDLVGTGPEPAACVARIREAAAAVVRGNHDHAIAWRLPPAGPEPFRSLAETTLPLAWAQLDGDALAYLQSLPLSVTLDLHGRRSLLVHATPHEPLHHAVGPDPAAWAIELREVDAELVMVGHTHVPFDLLVGGRRVVNPGSVGLPLDGNARAACAVPEDGEITQLRVPYQVERTIGALRDAPLPAPVVEDIVRWLLSGSAPPIRHLS